MMHDTNRLKRILLFNFRIELKSCILSAGGDKQVDAMVATKLLRDPPKCTATKPITQDFTKLTKGTFYIGHKHHLCTFMINPSFLVPSWQNSNLFQDFKFICLS